ncbi:hypothetical protein KC19_10G162800 [Ceratodon purpureus]|uniref:Uncharacterized protein n=1 Tax=Ceratodon purpureus TaxID=3225 RepID=A0A8T0GPS0_CERPU|nr:hypothetical protein KC19_10G162800 [Ceratodon purpureus]
MSALSLVCNLASLNFGITSLGYTHKSLCAVQSSGSFSSLAHHPQRLLPQPFKVTKEGRAQRRSSIVIKYSAMDTDIQADRRFSGRVLGPAPADFDWWDKKLLSGAVVVPEIGKPGYRMYYYGRGTDEWAKGVTPFNASLPTGRNGMAVSEDGLQFERYKGHLSGGAIMDPSEEYDTFDAVHLGVSDVFYDQAEDIWRMFYFGGGYDESPLPTNPEKLFRGLRLRPGVATSKDGLAFEDREGPILELGEEGAWDRVGVSWPRVLRPEGDGNGKWLLTYHTRETGGRNNFGFFSAGVATSTDGKHWQKVSKILSTGEPGTWDEGGVSVRHVLRVNGKYVMFYEGSDYKFQFAIGLATSDDGLVWEKDTGVGPEPGGPILKARVGENVWDNVIVGTPYVLAMDDGSFRMYYLGVGKLEGDEASKQGIGLAVSDGPNYRSWKRFNE